MCLTQSRSLVYEPRKYIRTKSPLAEHSLRFDFDQIDSAHIEPIEQYFDRLKALDQEEKIVKMVRDFSNEGRMAMPLREVAPIYQTNFKRPLFYRRFDSTNIERNLVEIDDYTLISRINDLTISENYRFGEKCVSVISLKNDCGDFKHHLHKVRFETPPDLGTVFEKHFHC